MTTKFVLKTGKGETIATANFSHFSDTNLAAGKEKARDYIHAQKNNWERNGSHYFEGELLKIVEE